MVERPIDLSKYLISSGSSSNSFNVYTFKLSHKDSTKVLLNYSFTVSQLFFLIIKLCIYEYDKIDDFGSIQL